MGRKRVKINQADSQNSNSIKTYMVQDKTDQRLEQAVERVEGIISSQEAQMKKNS